jgi:hypothetical protein
MSANLPLRDVQLPPAPSWWPPAPGYLMVGGAVLLVLLVIAVLWWRRRRRRQRWLQLFDRNWPPPPTLRRNWRRSPDCCAVPHARHSRAVNRCAMMPGGSAWIRRARCPMRVAAGRRRLSPTRRRSDVAAVRSWARERYLAMLLERRR